MSGIELAAIIGIVLFIGIGGFFVMAYAFAGAVSASALSVMSVSEASDYKGDDEQKGR
jgi:hypothetical protein